jgi:nucleoside phosphorylase
MTTCVVVGLEQEAAIVRQACPKAVIVVGAGDAALLTSRLEAALGQNAVAIDRVVSVGICGGLNPALRAGDIALGAFLVYQLAEVACDHVWTDRMYMALTAAIPPLLSVQYERFTISDKAALRASTGADVVDEETFIAGSIADARGLPFAALRVVCDPASFELPPAALVRLTAAGADDVGAILRSIEGDLWQIPELVELAA